MWIFFLCKLETSVAVNVSVDWSPVDFTLDIFRCTIAGCGPKNSVDESGASDPHNILCGKRQGGDTQWIQHAAHQWIQSSNLQIDQLTNRPLPSNRSLNRGPGAQKPSKGRWRAGTRWWSFPVVDRGRFPGRGLKGATCLWCENYVRMGYHLFFGTWSKHHRKWRKPRKPRRSFGCWKGWLPDANFQTGSC